MPIAGGQPSRFIDLPRRVSHWVWAPDGRAIIYSATRDDVTNLWSQPLDGGKPSQITDFTAESIWEFDIASDGKRVALSRGHSTLDVVLIKDSK